MEYYKLIKTGGGYEDSFLGSKAFKVGKIYPADCTLWNKCNVGSHSIGFAFWVKVSELDYCLQEGVMPKYFVIKRVKNNPLWQRYVDWLNKTYMNCANLGGDCDGYYGFADVDDTRGTLETIKEFGENAVELTLEQWDKIINKTMEEEFELPEKWCVRMDKREVVDYCNVYGLYPPYKIIEDGTTYAHFPGWNDCTTCNGIKSGYTEITYSQFIKYVLNQEVMEENKEIIGWKLKEDCYEYAEAVASLLGVATAATKGILVSPARVYLQKAGILELWFAPIYKEKTLKFGGHNVTFEKVTSGVRITCNGETGTFSQIEKIYNIVLKKEKMMFGSQEVKEITYSDDTLWSRDSLKATATSIKIGCTNGTWGEFVAIYEKAKSML